jgi:hypothetical protein
MADAPDYWKRFTCELENGKLISGEYTVGYGALFVRDACGAINAKPLSEDVPLIELACQILRELHQPQK